MKILQTKVIIKDGEIRIRVPEDLSNKEVNVIIIAEEELQKSADMIRNHNAFLSGYEPEDEGLYDDYPTG